MLFNSQSLCRLGAKPDKGRANPQRGGAAKHKPGLGRHSSDDKGRHKPADQDDGKDKKGEKHRLVAALSCAAAIGPVIDPNGNTLWFRLRGQCVTDRIQYRLDRTHHRISHHKQSVATSNPVHNVQPPCTVINVT